MLKYQALSDSSEKLFLVGIAELRIVNYGKCSMGGSAESGASHRGDGALSLPLGEGGAVPPRLPRRVNRGSAPLIGVRFEQNYQNQNLGWCEAPQAVEHPRDTEKPPGTPSGRRLRLETIQSPVERLFPPSGGVSRGSVRVGGETFLLPSYGFSFGYKRKGVSIAPLTEAQSNIVGHKMRVNAITGRGYNPSVFSACETSRKSSSPYTGEPRSALRIAR